MAVSIYAFNTNPNVFQSLKGFQRFCGDNNVVNISLNYLFQSLKGFQRFCGISNFSNGDRVFHIVSIPKRVSEVLWPPKGPVPTAIVATFQSLKGFQRFCGTSGSPE